MINCELIDDKTLFIIYLLSSNAFVVSLLKKKGYIWKNKILENEYGGNSNCFPLRILFGCDYKRKIEIE